MVSAIGNICDRIKDLSEVSTSLAASVEEQTCVTVEMSRNVEGAAHGARGKRDCIESLAQAASLTSTASEPFVIASRELSMLAESLQQEAAEFVDRVRGE